VNSSVEAMAWATVAHAAVGAIKQQLRHRIDHLRFDEGLVTLHIDHHVIAQQPK